MSLIALGRDLPLSHRPGAQAFGLPAGEEAGSSQTGAGTAERAWEALTKFIPTEILAPYVAALSLASTQAWSATTVYVSFIVATPVAFLLFQFAKAAIDGTSWPALPPLVWRTVAATVAFAVWALSAPTNPVQAAMGGAAVAGFAAIVVSPILTALDAIALRLLRATSR